ncbi:sulfatase [uncultured Imperialibacter sp.]|uniref:sulfatase n=1 Tax=uncultured Imperialibacter sp. TaxID=1672639 RepID=UPI0030D8B03E
MSQYLTAFFLLCILCIGCEQKAARKPNILFILVDDLGHKDLSATGSNFYETPNIDKIAAGGMMFTQGYAASRVCSPSRASIISGRFTARHGITDWIGAKYGEDWRSLNRFDKLLPADYTHYLPHEYVTLPETLKENGYKTFFAGKWHLGDRGSYPENHGFDINVAGWDKGSPMGGYFSPYENPKISDGPKGENLSIRMAQETASFIESHKDSTFFAFLSFYAVHGPIQTNEEKWTKYRTKAEQMGLAENGFEMESVLPIRVTQDNPVYAGLVETMDEAVGIVLDKLKTLGLDENTIIVFTSDNGGVSSGDNFSTSNLPLRGGKGYQWEGGTREPFFIKVPWLNSNGAKSNVPVINTDFYPTLLELAKIPLKPSEHIDGVSLVPLLEGKSIAERPLYWHYPHYGNQGGEPSSVIRLGNWKLIHYWEDGREELYNLKNDEAERNNVASQEIETKEKLSKQLLGWLKEVNAKIPVPDPEYDPVKALQRHEDIVNNLWPRLEQQRKDMLTPGWSPNADWWGSKTID